MRIFVIIILVFSNMSFAHDIVNHEEKGARYYCEQAQSVKKNRHKTVVSMPEYQKIIDIAPFKGGDWLSSNLALSFKLKAESYFELCLQQIEEKYPNPALQNESYEISSRNPKTYIKLAMRRAQSYTLEQARTADIFTHDHHDSYIENPTPEEVRQVWTNHIFEMWSSLMASNYSFGEVHYEREYLLDEFKKIIEPHITQEKLNEYIHYLTNDLKEKELNSESWYANIPEDYKKVPWLYKKHILDKGLEEYAQWDIRGIDRPSIAKAKAVGMYVTPTITATAEVKEDA